MLATLTVSGVLTGAGEREQVLERFNQLVEGNSALKFNKWDMVEVKHKPAKERCLCMWPEFWDAGCEITSASETEAVRIFVESIVPAAKTWAKQGARVAISVC